MSKKNKVRFLKKCTVLCLIMDILITLVCLYVMVRTMELSATIIATLVGLWSIELFLNFLIKDQETKQLALKEPVILEDELTEGEVKLDDTFGQSV